MKLIKKIVKKTLGLIGFSLINKEKAEIIKTMPRSLFLYSVLNKKGKEIISPYLDHSTSQLGQDLFVASNSDNTKENYFVEFGATDGVTNSNTYILEKFFGWKGLLIEPAKVWHEDLMQNRECMIDKRCIYKESGKLVSFLEVETIGDAEPGLSTMEEYADNGDWASKLRLKKSTNNIVPTITLNDILDEYKAPYLISYMSIDTEGSELDIIKSFDFQKRKIKIITIEHNYHKKNRDSLYNLLTNIGYKRVLENISLFDDWYILDDLK